MREDDRREETEAAGERGHADERQVLERLRYRPSGDALVQAPGNERMHQRRSDEHPAERGEIRSGCEDDDETCPFRTALIGSKPRYAGRALTVASSSARTKSAVPTSPPRYESLGPYATATQWVAARVSQAQAARRTRGHVDPRCSPW